MPLEAPNLDDRRFTEIFNEMRSLIPRYAPEWTDHNLSDPGITLMQLFSWLGEMIVFRLNRVPDRNYIKFLKLLGVERKTAFPANAELTFKLAPDQATVVIPQGTQVGAEVKAPSPSVATLPALPPEPEEPVIFETAEPIVALGAELWHVQVFDGINFADQTTANATAGQRYHAFGGLAREGGALLVGLASNRDFPTDEINLMVRVFADPEKVKAHLCGDLAVEIRPPANIAWEYWNGADWRKLNVIKDETRALTVSGHVYFRGPRDIKKAKLGFFTRVADEAVYWIRCHLIFSQYENPPELDAVLINTVRAIAVVTARDEVIGSSNGQPDQTFRLSNTPIFASAPRSEDERLREKAERTRPPTEAEQDELDDELHERELTKGFLLEVDEGEATRPWEEVEDFFTSEPNDRHYVLNRAIGQMKFGNGIRGQIPVASNIIIARYYRYGGGARGNVGAGTITDLQTSVAGVEEVTNHWPAEDGANEEPVKDTRLRAPRELKARDRAVTPQDFEFLARQTPGVRVRRAHALPRHHPDFPLDVQVPGAITVIIVPESEKPNPKPSEGTMQTVCAYLNQRRLLTTEVFVAPPRYKQIKIEGSVFAKFTANPAAVKDSIEKALNNFLHPLTGGLDGQGWPLGRDVIYSEVFREVLQVDGVQNIDELQIVIDDERLPECEDAMIPQDHLVFSDGHDIDVNFTPTENP